jgi:tetratricopeptide (TPR) repeat protein
MMRFIEKKRLNYLPVAVVMILIAVLCSCTAYFNTVYNAEAALKKGQDRHQKIQRNFPDSIVVTPPSDAVGDYDRAIDKAAKAIETFPKAKKWHDDALFLMGKAHFYKKEMSKAIRRLRQLEQEFPASPLLPEAYLYLGKAYIEDDNLDKAEEVLMRAQERWPYLNNNQQISLLMISIALKRNGKSQAIGLLEAAARNVRSENQRIDIVMRTAELYIDLKQYQKAILLLKATPRRKDFPMQSYRMDRAMFVCHRELDSLDAAYRLIGVMINQKLYFDHMDEMLYLQGRLLQAMGKPDEAIKIYRKLTAGLDSTSVGLDTSQFKAKALYELALIYQKDKEDYKKTRSMLKLAAASRDTASSQPARRKLTAIDELYRLRSEGEKRDSATYRRKFTIGELFRFELDEPDSAYNQFILISRDSLADTALIPRALLQAAIVARDDLHDSRRCDSLLKYIVSRYPASEYAKTGQRELAIPLTVKTRADSAAEAFIEAEKLVYVHNDVKGAIKAFFEIAKTYSDLPIAPKGLFAAAWFSDNVLLKKKTARSLYEKICQKYPKSDYCTVHAKPRIKLVADTLEKLERMRRDLEKKQPGRKNSASLQSGGGTAPPESSTATAGEDQELFGSEDTAARPPVTDSAVVQPIQSDSVALPSPPPPEKSTIPVTPTPPAKYHRGGPPSGGSP